MNSNIGVYQSTEQVSTGTNLYGTSENVNEKSLYQHSSPYLVPDENIKDSTSDIQVSGNVYEICNWYFLSKFGEKNKFTI